MRVTRGRVEGERGASLVLALAFLALFGVFIVALLGFAEASFRATVGVHDQGMAQYAASSAVDTAIQRVRTSLTLGAEGDTTCGLSYPAVDGAPAVTVDCLPQPGSGNVHPGVDAPWNALLTLAGMGVDSSQSGTLAVTGPIFSNTNISLHIPGQPKLDATDLPVTARGSCGTNIADWTYATLTCNFSGSDITGDDPLYTSRLGELAAPSASNVNRPATCIGSGATATIAYTPGYYTDVRVLTQTASPCNNSSVTRWFQPGVYYFDFDFDAAITAVAGKD
jgi:hypothetical protein